MKNLKFIKELVSSHRSPLIMIVLVSILMSALETVEPLVLREVVTHIGEDQSVLVYGVIALVITMISTRLCSAYRIHSSDKMADQIRVKLQERLFSHFGHKDVADIEAESTGYMENMVTNDCATVYTLIRYMPKWFAELVSTTAFSIIMLGKLYPKLLLVSIPLIITMLVFELVAPKLILMKPYEESRGIVRKLVQFRTDKFAGIHDVVSFNMQDKELNDLHVLNLECLSKVVRKSDAQNIYSNILNLLRQLADLITIGIGGVMITKGEITTTDMLLFFSYSFMIYKPILSIGDFIDMLTDGFVALNKIREELDKKPTIVNSENACEPEIKGHIVLDNVGFSYDEQTKVLENVSIDIQPGEFVALVGPSGAGKSTVAKLVNRLYDVTDGSVTVDGVDVRDIDLGYLRSNIGTVRQDARLFNGTVLENILYAAPKGATKDDAVQAAIAANADSFIRSLPEGYDTNIGENGVKLSGGQKQRIAIARLFINNPSVCVFDEATSALDNKSEKLVKQAMDNLAENRTTIVIAHRLETIKNADKIIYIDNHGVQEQGTHDELMSKHGAYYALYQEEAV